MNQLDRLEALAQGLIEGTFSRLFQAQLQPVDLAHYLAVAIDEGRRNGTIADAYHILLNPVDYDTLVSGSSNKVETTKIQQYLTRLIQEADYQLTGPLQVTLAKFEGILPGEADIKVGRIANSMSLKTFTESEDHRGAVDGSRAIGDCETIDSELVDSESYEGETKKVLVRNVQHTARRWVLYVEGRQLRLGEPVINIGRALDNDVILSDPTVSRYHAQLRWREGCYHLCPPAVEDGLTGQQLNGTQRMGRSTPWTTVNQRSVIRHPLASSDVIVLGRTVLNVTVESARV